MGRLQLERPPKLSDIAASKIAEAIVGGRLRPGERLVETAISAELGISRPPLREALRALASEGLVEIRQNRGTYVAEPSREDLEAMVMFRALVEGAAIRLLAQRAAPEAAETIATLETVIAEMAACDQEDDHSGFLRRHWEFHRLICTGSGNPYLIQSWNAVSNLIRLYHVLSVGRTIDRKDVLRNDAAFLASLRDGMPAEAEELLRSQIIRIAYRLINVPIPPAVAGYVTRYVRDDGTVGLIEPGRVNEVDGA